MQNRIVFVYIVYPSLSRAGVSSEPESGAYRHVPAKSTQGLPARHHQHVCCHHQVRGVHTPVCLATRGAVGVEHRNMDPPPQINVLLIMCNIKE